MSMLLFQVSATARKTSFQGSSCICQQMIQDYSLMGHPSREIDLQCEGIVKRILTVREGL